MGVPVVDHWWQTETSWAIAATCLGIERLPVVPGSPGRPAPGWDVTVLDDHGRELPPGQTGALTVRLPMPPGAAPTLWNADDRFRETYLSTFPGFKTATVVSRLPKTRSGKVLRATIRKIADGQEFTAPATIDDPAILEDIAGSLHDVGYPADVTRPDS